MAIKNTKRHKENASAEDLTAYTVPSFLCLFVFFVPFILGFLGFVRVKQSFSEVRSQAELGNQVEEANRAEVMR